MKITKGEAIALNFWGMIKKIKEIDENDSESIKLFLYNRDTRYFSSDFFSKIHDGYEIELDQWEFLRLIKLYNDNNNNDLRLLK